MLALRPRTTVSPRRKKIALAIAAMADAVQLGFFPVFGEGGLSIPDDALDAVVALLLVVTLGYSWRMMVALAAELVPGVALFPTWTAFVLTVRSDAPALAAAKSVRAVEPAVETTS
jgi:hypothetical protein